MPPVSIHFAARTMSGDFWWRPAADRAEFADIYIQASRLDRLGDRCDRTAGNVGGRTCRLQLLGGAHRGCPERPPDIEAGRRRLQWFVESTVCTSGSFFAEGIAPLGSSSLHPPQGIVCRERLISRGRGFDGRHRVRLSLSIAPGREAGSGPFQLIHRGSSRRPGRPGEQSGAVGRDSGQIFPCCDANRLARERVLD
jgi:hypothetical protein